MNLSPNFTLDEFTRSATAISRGWTNDPEPELMPTLRRTAAGLEMIRDLLGSTVSHVVPIIITSGLRVLRLNRAIGSRDSSQHVRGEAVDFVAPRFGTPAQIVRAVVASTIPYDQIISESTKNGARWVHVSFTADGRRQALEIDSNGVREWGG